MSMAAKDYHGDDIYVAKRLRDDSNEKEENTGSIAALFGESVFPIAEATPKMTDWKAKTYM